MIEHQMKCVVYTVAMYVVACDINNSTTCSVNNRSKQLLQHTGHDDVIIDTHGMSSKQ